MSNHTVPAPPVTPEGPAADAATSLDPLFVFGAIAALIFLGFLGNLIFSKLRFNDTLLLILVGVLLGPVYGLVPQQSVQDISIYVGPLALILILFHGGLALRFGELLHGLGGAAVLAVVGFTTTTLLVGLVAWLLLPVTPMVGFILGAILGGTSALVVMPSIAHVRAERRTATALSLESALTDVMVVVVAFTLVSIQALGQGPDAQGLASRLVITFAMSIMLGALAGLLWLWAVPHVEDKPFGYMLTLGFMFALYILVEWLLQDTSQGGGPLAVLAFGVILGNASGLGKRISQRVGESFGEGMKKFQGEIAFLVRTFFFIYLGVLVDLALLRDPVTWAVSLAVFAALGLARYLAVATANREIRFGSESWIMWVMMPRGLAAAVLAAVPANEGFSGTERFVAIAFLILVLTNLTTTLGTLVVERAQRSGAMPTAGGGGRGGGGAAKKGTKKGAAKGYTAAKKRKARSQPRRPGKPKKS